jgi:Tetratricopeptide repeat
MSQSLEELIAQLAASGQIPPELLKQIQGAMDDPAKLDAVLSALKGMGADQMGSAPLNIEDYYREGRGLYALRWPIGVSLPMAFERLDRKTQFFVLFQEWTRREMEGSMALNGGQIEEAKSIFEECLERAQQIEVGELEARSYEGLARVADRLGDRAAGREYSNKAAQARAA